MLMTYNYDLHDFACQPLTHGFANLFLRRRMPRLADLEQMAYDLFLAMESSENFAQNGQDMKEMLCCSTQIESVIQK